MLFDFSILALTYSKRYVDRRIIDKLNLHWKERGKYDWTKLDDIDKYKTLIGKCREEAGRKSIAEWELKEWTTGAEPVGADRGIYQSKG